MAVRVPGSALQPVHAWVVCGAIPAKEIDRLRSAIRLTRGEFSSRRRIGQSATVSTRLTIVSFFSSFLGALCSVAQCAIGKEICMLYVVRSKKKRLFLDCQIVHISTSCAKRWCMCIVAYARKVEHNYTWRQKSIAVLFEYLWENVGFSLRNA